MSVRKYLLLLLSVAAVLQLARPVLAQPEARFQVVQTGVAPLKEDLKYLVELSPTPALKGQWKTLEGLIDSFAQGLNETKPIRVDVIVGKDVDYELHVPIAALTGNNGFIANVKGLGYKVAPVPGTPKDTLFTLTPGGGGGKGAGAAAAKKPAYMRYVAATGYASIAATQAAIPANMPDPIKGVQPLLAKNLDVAAYLKNDADGLTARKANFQQLRRQLEAGLTFKRGEDKNEFALRKLSLAQNLNEAERFVVETEELLLGWTTSIADKSNPGKGHADFSISALPGTSLAASTQILASKPSYFANVELNAKPVVSGKVNFAIDDLRAGHLKEFYATVRPIMEAQIDKRATLEGAAQKAAAKKGAGLLVDLLTDNLQLKCADFFMDLHSAGDGKYTLVCGARVSNGKTVDKIIALLPEVNAGREVKMDIQALGDASLHSVAVPQRRQDAFHKLFPGENVIYIATSADAVWGAAGVNAIAELETAMKATAKPAPETADPKILSFTAEAARLVELMDIVRPEPQKIDETLSKEELARARQREKEVEQIRKLAIDATKNCDAIFNGEVKKNGNAIEGSLDVSECVLKFVGSVIADFAKNMQ